MDTLVSLENLTYVEIWENICWNLGRHSLPWPSYFWKWARVSMRDWAKRCSAILHSFIVFWSDAAVSKTKVLAVPTRNLRRAGRVNFRDPLLNYECKNNVRQFSTSPKSDIARRVFREHHLLRIPTWFFVGYHYTPTYMASSSVLKTFICILCHMWNGNLLRVQHFFMLCRYRPKIVVSARTDA